jgi:hypothetical protein
VRRIEWLATFAAARQCAGQLAIAFALLWPMLLLATDHHGMERISTHEHMSIAGGTIAPHSHAIAPHRHDGDEQSHGAESDADPANIATPATESKPALTPATPRATARLGALAAPSLAGFVSLLAHNSTLPLVALFTIPLLRRPACPNSGIRPPTSAGVAPLTPPPRSLIAA